MEKTQVIGIDVGKLKLDCWIHSIGEHRSFPNDLKGITSMVEWSHKSIGASKEELMFVFEHTGLYGHRLSLYLGGKKFPYVTVPGLEIKRSMGIVRGKDDRVDARRIALYGYRLRDELVPVQNTDETLELLKRLMSLRRKLVAQRAGHIATLGEQRRALDLGADNLLFEAQREVIKVLDSQIRAMENELESLVENTPELQRLFTLLTSVKGIGPVTARYLIVRTEGFRTFGSWRKFASYCGIAPFPNSSGTSLRGRTKVSHLADKQGKALLNLCATSAIRSNPEMRAYYQRRVAEGKNKMSTINIIRNKLLARAFAVIKRGTPYVNTMAHAN